MKVLVLGASGMAGHMVSLYLREQGVAVDSLSNRQPLDDKTVLMDVMDLPTFRRFLSNGSYDAVINCIGILVKQSDQRKDLSSYLNGFLPHLLEHQFSGSKTKVIHLSTDCVFSGEHPPYHENSPYEGELFYDRSKALGEIINDKDLTFRMSIIGPEIQANGVGLFNWFYSQTGEISGYTEAMWTGVTTLELAKAIKLALEQNLSGLYHLVPDHNISKFDLLSLFKSTFGRNDILIKPDDKVRIDKTLVNTRQDFNFLVQDYPAMTQDMKIWIESHKDLYPHYLQGAS